MPHQIYVQRDRDQRIRSVSLAADAIHTEALPATAPQLAAFARRIAAGPEALQQSDLGLARVLEDLLDLLIERNVLRFTDLPEAARSKLLRRQDLRRSLGDLRLLGDEDDLV